MWCEWFVSVWSFAQWQAVDFESKRAYTLRVEASNVNVDPRFFAWGPFKDTATVKVTVEDEDEPPVFTASGYNFEVEENAPEKTIVGQVHAKDTDIANKPIRYEPNCRHSIICLHPSTKFKASKKSSITAETG